MGHFIKFTFTAFDKDFSVHVDDKDISTPVKMLNEPFPGWWSESSPTDFYWSTGNNFD